VGLAPPTSSLSVILAIFLPQDDDLWLYMACSKVTSDFIVDRLE
jgi:hypothetical protein